MCQDLWVSWPSLLSIPAYSCFLVADSTQLSFGLLKLLSFSSTLPVCCAFCLSSSLLKPALLVLTLFLPLDFDSSLFPWFVAFLDWIPHVGPWPGFPCCPQSPYWHPQSQLSCRLYLHLYFVPSI